MNEGRDKYKWNGTYHQTLNVGLSGRSGGVHYDTGLRICMYHEERIGRRPGSKSVSYSTSIRGH